jgi:site-specific recombinase XerC
MLFDWLVVGQVVRGNPASVVRGPKHVIKRGKTPVLSPEEARELFDGIPTDTLVGLRDRALIGVLIYSFALVNAAVSMRVEDYFPQGKRWWLRLHEKGGKHHEMPVHHTLEEYLDAYIEASPRARCSGRQTGKPRPCRIGRWTGKMPSTWFAGARGGRESRPGSAVTPSGRRGSQSI